MLAEPIAQFRIDPLAPNSIDEEGAYFNPWQAMGFGVSAHHYSMDLQAIDVLRAIDQGLYCADIAERLNLSPGHVELFQTMFSSACWCVFDNSPRGCLINREHGSDFGSRLIAAWEDYYDRHWN